MSEEEECSVDEKLSPADISVELTDKSDPVLTRVSDNMFLNLSISSTLYYL